jgi:hypothetical protein
VVDKLAVPKPDRAIIPDTQASRLPKNHGVFDFRRYPHSATRTMLLEVAFIQGPQFNVLILGKLLNFF